MRVPNVQALAVSLALACILVAPAPRPFAAASPTPADEWLDTIRATLRADEQAVTCPGVGVIAFEAGRAEPSGHGRHRLDALAAALTSTDLGMSRFTVLWLAKGGTPVDLSERRAAVIEADLRSRPALPPERLTVERALAAFEDCRRLPESDDLLLQVRITGRWWGGQ